MLYTSTRNKTLRVEASEAITRGISEDGGLFVPVEIPKLSMQDIQDMIPMSYIERAKKVLSLYLTDFTPEEIDYCVSGAYAEGKFDSDKVAPLVTLDEKAEVLELFRGPTCAFKDMALQLLPYLLTTASKKAAPDKQIVILVATSGDTGKAALEGFKDVPGTRILVFYPRDGVSPMQKLQMVTQEGANVGVCAIEGNFDDAQSGVKKIFTDKAVGAKLAENGLMFSSANSINWGRLVPQIVYYCSAYADMLEKGNLQPGEAMDIVVPTGNFGNILAAYYAKLMGVPVGKLICASNANNVLTDFLTTGTYDRNRTFSSTRSPMRSSPRSKKTSTPAVPTTRPSPVSSGRHTRKTATCPTPTPVSPSPSTATTSPNMVTRPRRSSPPPPAPTSSRRASLPPSSARPRTSMSSIWPAPCRRRPV